MLLPVLVELRRRDFVRSLGHQGGRIDLNRMSPSVRTALASRGVQAADLRRIAGSDRVIRGAELGALYDRLFAGGGGDAAGRSGDLDRARALYTMLRAEAQRHTPRPAATPDVGIGRSPTGLRARGDRAMLRPGGDIGVAHGGGSVDLDTTYGHPMVPVTDAPIAPPEEPNWFMKIIEFLFGWLGLETDADRLRGYGEQIADEFGAELQAFRDAYMRAHGEDRYSNDMLVGVGQHERDMRAALVGAIAARMEAQGVCPDNAHERAGIVVDAMLAKHEANREANGRRGAELGIPAPESREGRLAAASATATRAAADRISANHPEWGPRVDAAMTPMPDNHRALRNTSTDEQRDRIRAYVIHERMQTLSYLMALDQQGSLDSLGADKDRIIDGMLAAERDYLASGPAVTAAISSLARMPEDRRARILAAVDSVPEALQPFAWAQIAREYAAFESSDAAEVEGAVVRIERAAVDLQSMDEAAANVALDRGRLGLEQTTLTLDYGSGRTIDLPVFFHPAVSAEHRAEALDLLREAYARVPHGVMQAIAAGEAGQAFEVHVLSNASLAAGNEANPERPTTRGLLFGVYQNDDNLIRLNMSALAHGLERPGGRDSAINTIIHESAHELDDLGDASDEDGFFVPLRIDRDRDRRRLGDDGDLAPSWAHVRRARAHYDEVSNDILDNPDRRRHLELSIMDNRTDAEEAEYRRLSADVAARGGVVTRYAATGGNNYTPTKIAEWWADTYAHYLTNPDRLRSIDPVAHRAAERYTAMLEAGTAPDVAMQTAMRFALAPDVAAEQGVRMIGRAPADAAMSDETLSDLEAIGRAFEDQAAALNGWTGYEGDRGLRGLRRGEAELSVEKGRELLTAIANRRAAITTGSPEDRRLAALETNLRRSITNLETQIRRLGG